MFVWMTKPHRRTGCAEPSEPVSLSITITTFRHLLRANHVQASRHRWCSGHWHAQIRNDKHQLITASGLCICVTYVLYGFSRSSESRTKYFKLFEYMWIGKTIGSQWQKRFHWQAPNREGHSISNSPIGQSGHPNFLSTVFRTRN